MLLQENVDETKSVKQGNAQGVIATHQDESTEDGEPENCPSSTAISQDVDREPVCLKYTYKYHPYCEYQKDQTKLI